MCDIFKNLPGKPNFSDQFRKVIKCYKEVGYNMWIVRVFVSCDSHAFASVHCCLVIICPERADLLAVVGDVYCIFATVPCGILGQVWYLIVSFPDLYRLS